MIRELLHRGKKNIKEEEEEIPTNTEEEDEEVTASREERNLAKPEISDAKEAIMRRREEQWLEPEEEEGGGSFNHTTPYPISIMPKAKEGETSQEGRRGRLNLGVGNRNLGPAPNNVKPTQSLEEACGRRLPPV